MAWKRTLTAMILCLSTVISCGCGSVDRVPDAEKMQAETVLHGKTAVFFGDSLCAGKTVEEDSPEYGYGWGGMIGEQNRMNWKNYGRNGAVIAEIEGQDRILSQQVEKAAREYEAVDYILFEGGCNDADQLKDQPEAMGEISEGYTDFDCTTYTGAFENLILQMLTEFPDARIGYVIPPKMGQGPYDAESNIRRRFFDRSIEVCEKWGIPYLDLWNENPMNPALEPYYQIGIQKEAAAKAGLFYTDSQHLTLRGYQRILSQIQAFMCGL